MSRRVWGLLWWGTILVSLAFFLFPIYWVFQMAVKTERQIYAWPPVFFFLPTLEHVREILFGRGENYLRFLGNSAVVAAATTLVSTAVAALAGYALSRHRFRGAHLLLFWVLITRILPPVAMAVPLYLLMRTLGLLNTYLGVVLGHLTFILPMSLWVIKSFFDEVPMEIEDAACIDGATPLQVFWRIAVPLASPGILSAAILSAIFSWNDFLYALILTGPETQTMPIAVAAFRSSIGLEWGKMAAAAVLTVTPMLVFAFLAQRHLIRGLTGGALK
jgi:ABC-type glycerol-3-phosphate transport system permease component